MISKANLMHKWGKGVNRGMDVSFFKILIFMLGVQNLLGEKKSLKQVERLLFQGFLEHYSRNAGVPVVAQWKRI